MHWSRTPEKPVRFRRGAWPCRSVAGQDLGKIQTSVRFAAWPPEFCGYRPMVGPESSKLQTTVRLPSSRSKFAGVVQWQNRALPTLRSRVQIAPLAPYCHDCSYSISDLRNRPGCRPGDTTAQVSLGRWPTGKALVLQTSFQRVRFPPYPPIFMASLSERLRKRTVNPRRRVRLPYDAPVCAHRLKDKIARS